MRLKFKLMPGSAEVNAGLVRGAGLSLKQYLDWLAVRDELTRSVDVAISRVDGWLMPATLGPAFAHQKAKPLDIDGRQCRTSSLLEPHARPFNVTGNPVVVLPAGRTEDGLPLGLQLVGRRSKDEDLLDLATAVASVLDSWQRPAAIGDSA